MIEISWKELGRKRPWPVLCYSAGICLEEVTKGQRNLRMAVVPTRIRDRHLLVLA